MRSTVLLMLALAVCAGAAYADTSSQGVATVTVKVNPNVAVAPVTPVVRLSDIQTGEFSAAIGFNVRANDQYLDFFVDATKLYKAGDPLNLAAPPIPLLEDKGVDITAPNAFPLPGEDSNVAFISNSSIGIFPARQTEKLTLESSQIGIFDQVVTTTVFWIQSNDLQPEGDYTGKVALTAMIK